MFSPEILALLGCVGVLAGFVDAIAGGGGLIALPMLLSVGVPPIAALATNKLQSAVGTATAAMTFWRKGFVEPRTLIWAIAATFSGSWLGAFTVKNIDVSALKTLVPIVLIAVALYFLLAPKLSDDSRAARFSLIRFAPLLGFAIGFYDGIFGPGTGSFFTIGFVSLFGLGLTRAAAHTKLLNFTSNAAALALFIPAGDVIWPVAIVMALGQLIGGYLGALTGIRFGAALIRPLVVVISIALAIRLLVFAG